MTLEKDKVLEVTVSSENQRMHYTGSVEGQPGISIDYTPPLGDNLGYTSLELLLISLASCVTATITTMLRSNKKVIRSASCIATGHRRQENPRGFASIDLKMMLESGDLTDEEVETTIQVARDAVCPVWNMIRKDVPVDVTFEIRK